jgi:hypothetical protein
VYTQEATTTCPVKHRKRNNKREVEEEEESISSLARISKNGRRHTGEGVLLKEKRPKINKKTPKKVKRYLGQGTPYKVGHAGLYGLCSRKRHARKRSVKQLVVTHHR